MKVKSTRATTNKIAGQRAPDSSGTPSSPHASAGGLFEVAELESTSFREQASRAIRAALITGEMRTGRVYSVPSIAAQFGVSPTPIREAILDLVSQGLAEPVRNKGFRVLEVSAADLDEIFELRLLLEVPTLGRLAGQISKQDSDHFWEIVARTARAADQGDLAGFLDGDRTLHLELLSRLGNRRLVEIVDRLRLQSRLPGLEELAGSGALAQASVEHSQILDALIAGERTTVERLMTRHLRHTRGIWAGIHE